MTNYQDFATKSGARVTEWKFDGYRGFETNKVTAGVAGRSYSYTPAGRWASRTWARGITTTYAYDNSGDLYSINYSDGLRPASRICTIVSGGFRR